MQFCTRQGICSGQITYGGPIYVETQSPQPSKTLFESIANQTIILASLWTTNLTYVLTQSPLNSSYRASPVPRSSASMPLARAPAPKTGLKGRQLHIDQVLNGCHQQIGGRHWLDLPSSYLTWRGPAKTPRKWSGTQMVSYQHILLLISSGGFLPDLPLICQLPHSPQIEPQLRAAQPKLSAKGLAETILKVPQQLYISVLMSKAKRVLSVFDMDSTIAQSFIEQCLFYSVPEHERYHYAKLTVPWPHILKIAMDKYPVRGQEVQERLKHIKLVHNIKEVLDYLKGKGSELIVLSGANDHMCWEYLKYHNIDTYFSRVIANKMSYFQHEDRYELELPEVRKCRVPYCGRAPCKKHELTKYSEENKFDQIHYFGDGLNDLCGMSAVGSNGRCYVRKQHQLHQMLQADEHLLKYFVKPPEYWHDGDDLLRLLKL